MLQLQNLKLQLEKCRNFWIQPSQTCFGVGIFRVFGRDFFERNFKPPMTQGGVSVDGMMRFDLCG